MAPGSSEASDASRAHPPAPARPGLVLALLCTAQLMLILDVSVVNIALPSMQRDLGFSAGGLQWVISGYSLTFGGLLILGGRCGDLFGRVRFFQLGIAVFSLASLLGGLAVGSAMLVVGRLAQGVGAALVAPSAMALLTGAFAEGDRRNRALGVWGAASAAGGAVGILLGGPLTEVSWRAVLLINVPIGIVAIIGARRIMRESHDPQAQRLDVPGAVLVTVAVAALVYGLSTAATRGFGDARVIVALATGVVLGVAFVAVQARTTHALVPLRVFTLRNLNAGNVAAVLLFGVSVGTVYFLTLYLQDVLGYSALQTGLAFLPNAVVTGLVATSAGRLMSRIGVRGVVVGGLVVLVASEVLFMRIDTQSGYFTVLLLPLVLNAVGLGAAFVAVSIAATSGVPADEQGLATSLFTTAQQIGAAIGLAVLVVLSARHAHPAGEVGAVVGYRWGFGGAAAFAFIALIVSVLVLRAAPVPDSAMGMAGDDAETRQER